jgi:hypothetical protein
MSNAVLLKNDAPHHAQARMHRGLAEHLSSVRSKHHYHYEHFIASANTSIVPEIGRSYQEWWSSLGGQLAGHTHIHQHMADSLTGHVKEVHEVDSHASSAIKART